MARAPRQIGDKVVIGAVDGTTGLKKYALVPTRNNVSYETVSEQPEVQPNQALAWPLTFHGGIGYSHYNPQQAGWVQGGNILTHEPNVIRAPLAATAVTLTGAANPVNYMFETNVGSTSSGKPVLYAIANESAEVNVYKISLDSADYGTLLSTQTFSVTPTQPCGQPAEWNNGSDTRWYLGLGDPTNKLQRLDTVATGTNNDTWQPEDSGTGTADARHLKVVGNRLMRSTGANEVSLLPRAGNPLTEASWGSEFFIGDVSADITELGESGGLGYIAKTDGFYEWDTVGQAVNIFPEIGKEVRGGQGMVYWHGGFMIPSSALWWTRTGKPVGPDSNPHYSANDPSLGGPASSEFVKQGRYHGLAPFDEYIYADYKCGTQTDNTTAYVLWGRERDRDDPPGWGPIVWHGIQTMVNDFDDFHAVKITELSEFTSTDIRPCLWFCRGNNLDFIFLDKDGSPFSVRGEIDVRSGASSVFTGRFDFGHPRVLKQLWKIDGWAEDMSSTDYNFRFRVRRDGGSAEDVGGLITTDGYFESFWTQDSNDTTRSMLVDVQWNGTTNLTNLNGPHLRDVMVRAYAVPDVSQVWTLLFAVEDGMNKTAKKIRSELEAFRSDLKQYELPDGDSFNGVMGQIRLLRSDEIRELMPEMQPPPKYVLQATVREMVSS